MKKVLVASACAALLASSALAEGFFLGGEGAWLYSHGNFKESELGTSDSGKANSADLGLKVGYVINDNNRVYGTYHYQFGGKYKLSDFEVNVKGKTHKFLLGYDFTPQIYNEWRGVLGVYGGYTLSKMKPSEGDFINFKKGLAYGAKVGTLYDINENNEMEFGFKAEQLNYSKKQGVKPTLTNAGLYVGYAYKF